MVRPQTGATIAADVDDLVETRVAPSLQHRRREAHAAEELSDRGHPADVGSVTVQSLDFIQHIHDPHGLADELKVGPLLGLGLAVDAVALADDVCDVRRLQFNLVFANHRYLHDARLIVSKSLSLTDSILWVA